MFDFFKNKYSRDIYAPINGRYLPIEEVKDEVFAKKVLGDGFAIIPEDGNIVAPFKGEVVMLFPTKHAIGIRNQEGIELLIHVGMDTVNMEGKGFTSFVKVGSKIDIGTPLIHFDKEELESQGYDLTIPCVFTKQKLKQRLFVEEASRLKAGKTVIIAYEIEK